MLKERIFLIGDVMTRLQAMQFKRAVKQALKSDKLCPRALNYNMQKRLGLMKQNREHKDFFVPDYLK